MRWTTHTSTQTLTTLGAEDLFAEQVQEVRKVCNQLVATILHDIPDTAERETAISHTAEIMMLCLVALHKARA